MDQYLNPPRLAMVMGKIWFEQKRTIVMLFPAIGAAQAIWLSLNYSFDAPHLFRPPLQVAYYFIGLYMSGFLSASFLFSEFRSKPRAISFLMLPASQLEKFLCILFFGVVVFWFGYSAVFTVVNFIFVTMVNNKFETTHEIINAFTISNYSNPFLPDRTSALLYIYFAFHALFLLGSIYFARFGFFKTLIVLLLIWVAFMMAPAVMHTFLPPGTWISSMAVYEVFDYHGATLIELPGWFRISISFFLGYVVTATLWVVAYFRLTERQIV